MLEVDRIFLDIIHAHVYIIAFIYCLHAAGVAPGSNVATTS